MTDKTIDLYFTPSPAVKRQRARSSPGSSPPTMDNSERVGNLTQGQLMEGLATLLDSKLAKLATKEDLAVISSQVSVLTEENKVLQEEVRSLKTEQRLMKAKLIDLESRSRRNNLVFKGLRWDPKTTDFRQVVKKFCADMFGCDRLYVNRAHPLGKSNSTVIAHIPDDSEVEYIMSQTGRLKGTTFVVHRDYPAEVREKRGCLIALRKEIERVAGRRRMALNFDHITVEGVRFSWEGGKLRAGPLDGAKQLQEMFRHDFSEFLSGLGDPDRRQRRRSPPAAAQQKPETSDAPQATSTATQR